MSEPTRAGAVRLDDAADLDRFVDAHDRALVTFRTAGCSMCDAMEPVLGNVARASDVAVALVNPRDDPPLLERYGVRSVPLLVYFEDGEPVRRLADGFVGTGAVLAFADATEEGGA